MESLLQEVFNSGFENCHNILIFVLDDVVFLFVLLVGLFLVFIVFGVDLVSFFLDLEDFFGGFEDAVFDFVDFTEELPVGDTIFPSISTWVDFAGSKQYIEISQWEGSSCLIIYDYIPNFLFKFLYFILIHFQSIINWSSFLITVKDI